MSMWPMTPGAFPDLALSSDRVDIWLLFTDSVAAASELTVCYQNLLTVQETEKAARFYFAKDAHSYLLTRALVRTTMSRYVPIAAADWRFEPDRHGRPMIVNRHEQLRHLSFNISHTDGLIILAVTSGNAIGVDTECTRRQIPLEVADSCFSPREIAVLGKMPQSMRHRGCLELWTFKESYVKARGMGLSIPLDKFSFDPGASDDGAVHFEDAFDDSPSRWAFYQFRPSEDHTAALCIERSANPAPELVCRRIVPLRSEQALDHPILRLGSRQSGRRATATGPVSSSRPPYPEYQSDSSHQADCFTR
jgi:4'-phosphopantetheinyl transferase